MKRLLMLGLLATAVPYALAVEIKAGDWTVDLGGNINAYYTVVKCSGDFDAGLALAGRSLGCAGRERRTTVGNGLLPSVLTTTATSNQGGWDVKALIGIYVHTATDSAIAQNSQVDVRQAFFTFGRPDVGTVKLGRDIGFFGSHAILGDMTLQGAGAPVQATQRGRVALGHIGAGYAYANFYGQVAYSAPTALPYGIGLDLGLMSPVADTPISVPPRYSAASTPQVQLQLSGASGPVKGWLGVKTQDFDEAVPGTSGNLRMNAIELGTSMDYEQLSLLANVQHGKGLGILSDADQADVKQTHYFVQAVFKTNEQLKLGINYGQSRNSRNAPSTFGLKSNANLTLGAYYALNKVITLVGELSHTRSESFGSASSHMNGVAVGGIINF